MLAPPIAHIEAIDRDTLNRCLLAWEHKMGPWERPDFGQQSFHALCHHNEPVAVTASARLIPKEVCGLSRDVAFELGRLCAVRPGLCRVMLRSWREFVFPALCAVHGWSWAISYQDANLHTGNTYRFDGWVTLGKSRSGPDRRGLNPGRNKIIWGWTDNTSSRALLRQAA